MKGTVVAGTNNLFTVECEDEVIRNCTIKGKVIKTEKEFYNPIAPGDFVELEPGSFLKGSGNLVVNAVVCGIQMNEIQGDACQLLESVKVVKVDISCIFECVYVMFAVF